MKNQALTIKTYKTILLIGMTEVDQDQRQASQDSNYWL